MNYDESAQCLEGEHIIAMTHIGNLKAVVLLGDHEQLPTTIISERSNEGAKYLKRSLMERLYQANYPMTILWNNYRNKPHMLNLYNGLLYNGQLQSTKLAGPTRASSMEVGTVQHPAPRPTQSQVEAEIEDARVDDLAADLAELKDLQLEQKQLELELKLVKNKRKEVAIERRLSRRRKRSDGDQVEDSGSKRARPS